MVPLAESCAQGQPWYRGSIEATQLILVSRHCRFEKRGAKNWGPTRLQSRYNKSLEGGCPTNKRRHVPQPERGDVKGGASREIAHHLERKAPKTAVF